FVKTTTYFEVSKYITHSIISPLLKEIERCVKLLNLVFKTNVDLENIDNIFEKIDKDTYEMLEKVKYHLYKAIKIYWHTEEDDALISAILNPKIKSFTFINNQDLKDQVKTLLQNKYNILKGENLSPILPEIRSILLQSFLYQTSLFSIFKK
ncbi:15091_t:CDS:2, partial [Funneliformis caledonium]